MSAPGPPRWKFLSTFALLNGLAGVLILRYLSQSLVLVSGFGLCLFLLGICDLGWFISCRMAFKKKEAGISIIKIVSSASAVLYITMWVLLRVDAGSAYATALQTAPNPGALANQYFNSLAWLTLLCIFYASAAIYFAIRFRHIWAMPQLEFRPAAMFGDDRIRRLALWWLAVNSIGVAISIAIYEVDFLHHVDRGDYNPPGKEHLTFLAVWLALMILLGAVQVWTCCWPISRMRIRNTSIQVVLGVVLGALTAFVLPILAVFAIGSVLVWEPLIGIFTFLLSGIVFGSLTGYSQAHMIAGK